MIRVNGRLFVRGVIRMNDIIEKLRISKEKYPNEFDNLINASEIGFKSSIENRRKQLEYYREIEQQRNEMLEVLIESRNGDIDEPQMLDSIIEKTTGKSWEEIKELLP